MSKLIGGIIGIPVVISIISFILNAILALLLTLTYSSLTKENVVATVTFDKVEKQSNVYIAHLYSDSGSKIGDYKIYGDQWRIDAGFIKMEYWANVFGLDSKYTLDRFEGRYKDVQEENSQKHKAYLLESHNLIDKFSFFVDTQYGSSVYKDIQLNVKYIILKTQTGLIVREEKIKTKNEKSFLDKGKELFGI